MGTMKEAPIHISQARIDAIARRVSDAQIGYAPSGDNGRYGIEASWLNTLRDYWRDQYDWRVAEAKFNEMPAYIANIGGIDIHFFRLAGEGDRYPVILTHGWPGSVTEFLEAAPLLAARGYDVVVPSLPGYGFSGRPPRPIGPTKTAEIWRTLMCDVLGYKRFGAQGGDWGSIVTSEMGRNHSDVVAAIHLNMYEHRPLGVPRPEVAAYRAQLAALLARDGAYAAMHATRPQTIGLALADTPVGFAGWVCEKCRDWSHSNGDIDAVFTKDTLITNVMTYLVNDSVQSAMWMYRGYAEEPINRKRIEIPTGFAEFPGEFVTIPPRGAMEEDLNLVHWRKMAAGGHFAAWEQPAAFAHEVGEFFKKWR